MNTVNLIISLISQKGITEQKFLFDLGFNRTLLSDWKSGKSKSYMKHINKIADYFNVSTDYLLGNDIKAVNNDPELSEYLEELRTRPEMRMIFQLAKNATKEDVEKAVKIIEALFDK